MKPVVPALLLALACSLCITLGPAGCIEGRDHTIHELIAAQDNAGLQMELADHPNNVNQRGVWGETPLMRAVGCRNEQAVAILLKHGASPTQMDKKGFSPMDQVEGSIRICENLPAWLRSQENSMRGMKEQDVQRQMAKIKSHWPPEAHDQWVRIREMLREAMNQQPASRPTTQRV